MVLVNDSYHIKYELKSSVIQQAREKPTDLETAGARCLEDLGLRKDHIFVNRKRSVVTRDE